MNDTNDVKCNVCQSAPLEIVYTGKSERSNTSIREIVPGKTEVAFCGQCGHPQTRPVMNLSEYYDLEYNILTNSADEDQLISLPGGEQVFRHDHQAQTFLQKVPVGDDTLLLEYGCGKAATLRKIHAVRPGLTPLAFDVSENYREFWHEFLPATQTAVYTPREEWKSQVDVVASWFVLEHISDLRQCMEQVRELLKVDGLFYFLVPNTFENVGDLIVADHVNHFSARSIHALLTANNFEILEIDETTHAGAFIVVARKTATPGGAFIPPGIDEVHAAVTRISRQWSRNLELLEDYERSRASGPACIYGAGFYGSFIYANLARPDDVACFVDQNPHLQGTQLHGRPVVAPADLAPDLATTYVGLNPRYARDIVAGVQSDVLQASEKFFLS